MNKSLLYIALFFASVNLCKAQEKPIKFTSQRNTDNSIDINFSKEDAATYYLILDFRELTNCSQPTKQDVRINGYTGKVISLKPTDPSIGIGYSNSFRYILGTDHYKQNNFVYLIPFQKDTKVNVGEASYLMAKYFGKTTPADWKSYRFSTQEESTVIAARKGIVVSVKDIYDLDSLKSYAYKQENNELVIEHVDGSLARYSGFKRGSIAVKEGEMVYPETVLGKNSKYSADSKYYSLSFYVFYLKQNVFSDADKSKDESSYGFVTPLFYTQDGQVTLIPKQDYAVASNPDVVTKEMTKKELKKFKN